MESVRVVCEPQPTKLNIIRDWKDPTNLEEAQWLVSVLITSFLVLTCMRQEVGVWGREGVISFVV